MTADEVHQQQLAEQLLAQAKAQGVDLVGPDGLLNRITQRVLETAVKALLPAWVVASMSTPAETAAAPAPVSVPRRC